MDSLIAVIALGTWPEDRPAIRRRGAGRGQPPDLATAHPGLTAPIHEWRDPEALVEVGRIPVERTAELSERRVHREAPIVLNRHVVDCDVAIVVGPVFPARGQGHVGWQQVLHPWRGLPEFST